MIQRTHPNEVALVSTLEAMLENVKVVQSPHNLFREQSKRLRRCADNLEDALLEVFAGMAASDPELWADRDIRTLLRPLEPCLKDLEQIHEANHDGDNDKTVWASWGPPTAEVSAWMAVETLVELTHAVGKLAPAIGNTQRRVYGITEEESKAILERQNRPNIQIVGGNLDDLPAGLREMLKRLGGIGE